MNSEKLTGFTERLIKDIGHKIYLILNNLCAYRSKVATEWVEEHKEQVAFFYHSLYSLEFIPDEYLNHDLKQPIGHDDI